jgi:hypothetical protein
MAILKFLNFQDLTIGGCLVRRFHEYFAELKIRKTMFSNRPFILEVLRPWLNIQNHFLMALSNPKIFEGEAFFSKVYFCCCPTHCFN